MDIKTQKMLIEAISGSKKNKVAPYSTTATVKSVLNDTIYVEIPGSENATPVKASSVSVKAGDVVDLVVSHADTHIIGNRSDVAVSKTEVNKVSGALEATRLEMDNTLDLVGNTIKMLNNDISMQDNKIEMQNNTITEIGNTVNSQNNVIEQQNNTITEIGNTVNSQNNVIEQQNNTITEIGNKVNSQNNTITEIGNTVNSQGNDITELNNKVNSQNNTITEIGNKVNSQGNTITELDNTVAEIGNTVNSQGNTITEIGNTVESQGNTITEIGNTIELHDSSIKTLDSSIKIINSAFVIRDGKLTGLSEIVTNILDAGYVTTDLLNADVAWIENGKIKESAIGETEIADASITTAKVRDLSADIITSGTIRTERLILTTDEVDPKTGEKKVALITALNAKVNEGEGNILDGAVIADETIEAAKITVVDLNAFGATIGNFNIGTSSMYNGKTSLKDPTNGVYLGTDGIALGQGSLLDMTDDSPFRVESDGDFHLGAKDSNYVNFDAFTGELDINAKTIKMRSKSVASTEDVDELGNTINTKLENYATLEVTNNKISTAVTETKSYADGKASDAVSTAKSYTDQTAKSITSTVEGIDGRMSKMEQNADGFTWTIDKTAIVSSVNEYYKSDSATSLVGGSWSESQPPWEEGKYIWMQTKTTNGKGDIETSEPVCITGNTGAQGPKGEQGIQGEQGEKGATGPKGNTGATGPQGPQGPQGPKGNTGATGATGPQGPKGDKGDTGATGKGVKSITNYYLATSSSSGVTTSTSGWSTSVQSVSSSKKYLWNYEVVTYTDNSTSTTSPCLIGAYGDTGSQGPKGNTGATGKGISSITEYYLASSSSSGVTTSTSGWSTSMQTTDTTKKYLWNYEKITYTDGSTDNTTVRIIGTHGATGATGATGPQGPKGDTGAKGDKGATGATGPTGPAGQDANQIVHSAAGNGNSNMYMALATFTIKGPYVNTPVQFKITSRGRESSNVYIMFTSVNSADPGLSYIRADGEVPIWIQKTATSTWRLICQKNEPYGSFFIGNYVNVVNISVTWTSEHLGSVPSSTDTNPVVKATRLISEQNAAKTATNYMDFGVYDNGLTIGDLTGSSVGRNVFIDSDSVDIRNGKEVLASYGEEIVLRHGGKDVFTIKDSTFLSSVISNGRLIDKPLYESWATDSSGNIIRVTLGDTSISVTASYTYIWHINKTDRYAIFAPTSSVLITSIMWRESKPAFLYIGTSDGSYSDVPCSYCDSNAIIDVVFKGSMWIENSSDISGSVKSMPPLGIGTRGGVHLELDNNEISAKSNDISSAPLHLNMEGGNITFNNNGRVGLLYQNGTFYSRYNIDNIFSDWYEILNCFGDSDYSLIRLGLGTYSLGIGSTDIYGNVIKLTSKGNVVSNTNLVVPNGKGFQGTDTGGRLINNFQPCDTNNNCVIGLGTYSLGRGSTDIYGNVIKLTSKGNVVSNTNLVVPNGKGFQGTDTGGRLINNFQPCDTNNNCVIGLGTYSLGRGSTDIYGNKVSILSDNAITLESSGGNIYLNPNSGGSGYINSHTRRLKVLWSGVVYLKADQTVSLSESVSKQLNGIVLAWSAHSGSEGKNWWWTYTFIPKEHVYRHEGAGCGIILIADVLGYKYVYINDTTITGNAINYNGKTVSGISMSSNSWVLRYVYGV